MPAAVKFRIEVDTDGNVTVKDGTGGELSPCVSGVSREAGHAYDLEDYSEIVGVEPLTVLTFRRPGDSALLMCIKKKNCDIFCG